MNLNEKTNEELRELFHLFNSLGSQVTDYNPNLEDCFSSTISKVGLELSNRFENVLEFMDYINKDDNKLDVKITIKES